jgi:hypothetical protein
MVEVAGIHVRLEHGPLPVLKHDGRRQVLLVWRQHHVVRIGLLVTAFSSRFMEEAFSVVDAEITSSDNNKPAEGLIRNVIRQRKVPGLPEILDADSKAVRRRPLPVVIHSCKQEWSSRCQLEVISSTL